MNKHNHIYFTAYNDNVNTSEKLVIEFDHLDDSEFEESERLRKLFSKKMCRI